MPRLVAPETAFTSSLRQAARTESQGRATITKTEAEKALKNLDGAQPAERARIVQGFLDGKSAGALSPKAREVLADFVQKNDAGHGGGDSALDVKAAAREETAHAERNLQKAQNRLEQLIATGKGSEIKGGLQQVRAWLDAAEADVLQAKGQLKKLADSAAQAATRDLTGAQRDLGKAADDIQKLIDHAKAGNVKKADLAEVRAWLAEPLPELQDAVGALSLGPPVFSTMKAPSDAEDAGGGLAGGGIGVMHTLKFPSDNEDAGRGGAGAAGANTGVMHSQKYPSDNEDTGATAGVGGLKERKVSTAHASEIKKAFTKLDRAGDISWKSGKVFEHHMGVRFAQVELGRDKLKDGYTVTAFLPLGALTPTAKAKDPNKVDEFYLERTGGKRGTTETAGPFRL